MEITVSPHNEQEEKVLRAFLDTLEYDYAAELNIPAPPGTKRQTIEQYNQEIEEAIARVKTGNFTTQEDLDKEMKSW